MDSDLVSRTQGSSIGLHLRKADEREKVPDGDKRVPVRTYAFADWADMALLHEALGGVGFTFLPAEISALAPYDYSDWGRAKKAAESPSLMLPFIELARGKNEIDVINFAEVLRAFLTTIFKAVVPCETEEFAEAKAASYVLIALRGSAVPAGRCAQIDKAFARHSNDIAAPKSPLEMLKSICDAFINEDWGW